MKVTTTVLLAFYATLASTSPDHVLIGRQTGGLCVAGGVCPTCSPSSRFLGVSDAMNDFPNLMHFLGHWDLRNSNVVQ
jgi:hypothetical protein